MSNKSKSAIEACIKQGEVAISKIANAIRTKYQLDALWYEVTFLDGTKKICKRSSAKYDPNYILWQSEYGAHYADWQVKSVKPITTTNNNKVVN